MSQEEQIIRHLVRGRTLTPLEALSRFGVMALSQRITNLRREGWPIQTTMVQVGQKRVAQYRLT